MGHLRQSVSQRPRPFARCRFTNRGHSSVFRVASAIFSVFWVVFLGFCIKEWKIRAVSTESPACIACFQKNPRVRKMFCPQFSGWKWLRQFYGRLEKCVLSAGKKPFPIKFCVLGGGVFWVLGGNADFIFMGARIFLMFSEIPLPRK